MINLAENSPISRFLVLTLLLVLVPACNSAHENKSPTIETWIVENAVAVDNFAKPLSGPALDLLRAGTQGAQIVGLGESRHDTHEQVLFKGQLVRHMVEDLGFRIFILEESFPHAEPLDRYITSGQGDLYECLNQLAGWYLWETEEMADVFKWIRSFNEKLLPAEQVRVFGMDISAPAPGIRDVLATLHAVEVETNLNAETLGLELQQGDMWPNTWQRYGELTAERQNELLINYDQLVTTVKESEATIVAATSLAAYARTLLLAQLGQIGHNFFCCTDRSDGGVVREQGMAKVVLWFLEQKTFGDKAIMWAHNLHVSKSTFQMPAFIEGEASPMGVILHQRLGSKYVAIGATFGSGSYSGEFPPGPRTFNVPAVDVLDGMMASAGIPSFLIDIRQVPEGSPAYLWLQQDRDCVAQETNAMLTVGKAFDMLFFVDRISHSVPTAGALQRY